MSVNHHGNVQPEIDNEEHEHYLEPATKRVLAYGFDGAEKQILKTDNTGKLEISGSISGGITTVFQGGSWDIRSLNSTATIYAVVNTGGGTSNVTLNPGPNQIGSVTISHPITIAGFSGPTIYAVVNTGAVGNTNALATLLAGPNQIGSVTVSHVVNSITTIAPRTDYIGLASVSGNVVLQAGTSQIGSVTLSNSLPVGGATIGIVRLTPLVAGSAYVGLASVNIGGTLPALSAGTNQIGSVTISNTINSIVTVSPRTDYMGLVSVSGNVVLQAGTAQLGSVTVSNQLDVRSLLSTATLYAVVNTGGGSSNVTLNGGPNQIGSVTISHIVSSLTTILPRTDYIGLASVSGNVNILTEIPAGTKQIGSVTISNPLTVSQVASVATIYAVVNTGAVGTQNSLVTLNAGPNQIGSVTISNQLDIRSLLSTATIYAVVNTGGGASNVTLNGGPNQIGSVTVSNVINGLATVVHTNSGKTWNHSVIALSATNLSGATLLVSSASKKFYVTSLVLSTASVVGIALLNGPTYLVGNASVRMVFNGRSGIAESGNVLGPVLVGLANQTNLLIVTDAATPVAGKVVWYEE